MDTQRLAANVRIVFRASKAGRDAQGSIERRSDGFVSLEKLPVCRTLRVVWNGPTARTAIFRQHDVTGDVLAVGHLSL